MAQNRFDQVILLVATLLGSWLGMQIVHETGHVLGAWLTGGQVAKVVLHPLTISRTEVAENPHPLLVVWSGPVGGVLLPLLAWGLAAIGRCPGTYLLRFFAGFCLVANGAYIGAGAVMPVGDSVEMIRLGSPPWLLGAFGLATLPVGLWLWNGQGAYFGLDSGNGRVSRGAAYFTMALLLAVLALETILGGE